MRLGIRVACVLWGLDNNLSREYSSKDPLSIGVAKGLVSGAFSLGLALLLGAPLPGLPLVAATMLIGCLSYGLSIALFILAMRHIGAARASAWLGTAPFAGVIISFLIFQGLPGLTFLVSLPLMALGALLLFGEEHAHTHIHVHGTITHEHIHAHDRGTTRTHKDRWPLSGFTQTCFVYLQSSSKPRPSHKSRSSKGSLSASLSISRRNLFKNGCPSQKPLSRVGIY